MDAKEINIIHAFKAIKIFLRKFAAYKGIDEPNITFGVYYQDGKGVVFTENAEVNAVQHKQCYDLLLKLVNTKVLVSPKETETAMVGAVNVGPMIVLMAGIESSCAEAIMIKALHYAQAISEQTYKLIKDSLEQEALFAILEKWFYSTFIDIIDSALSYEGSFSVLENRIGFTTLHFAWIFYFVNRSYV